MADDVKVLIVEKNGVELEFREELALEAQNVVFDNSSNGFASDDLQGAVEEIGASASPGFSFGRSGNVSVNSWLRRPGNVPSNRAGVTIPINNPEIISVSCSNRNVDNYTVSIYEHEGNQSNLTLLGSINVINSTGGTFPVSFMATQGKQLAVRLTSGTVRDLGVDLVLVGNN